MAGANQQRMSKPVIRSFNLIGDNWEPLPVELRERQ